MLCLWLSLYFHLLVSSELKCKSWENQTVGSCFVLQSDNLCLLCVIFSPFIFTVIILGVGFKTVISAFVLYLSYLVLLLFAFLAFLGLSTFNIPYYFLCWLYSHASLCYYFSSSFRVAVPNKLSLIIVLFNTAT